MSLPSASKKDFRLNGGAGQSNQSFPGFKEKPCK